jgi:hypothetical protein
MKPICYLNPAKANNALMLEAFAHGSGAEITEKLELVPGRSAVFYGVDRQTLALWREVEKTGHPYFYIDNGYFRSKWQGGDHYRITRNAPQCDGLGSSTGERWTALDLKIQPWRRSGSHVLIACQSDFWHERHGHGSSIQFAQEAYTALRMFTQREVIIRQKPMKGRSEPPLLQALNNCWAVVTHSSMVALEAILCGVPACVTAPSALSPVSLNGVGSIESPFYPDDRERWAGVLADNQWSLQEIRSGAAWRALCEKAG